MEPRSFTGDTPTGLENEGTGTTSFQQEDLVLSSQGISMWGLQVDVSSQESTQVLMCSHQSREGKK